MDTLQLTVTFAALLPSEPAQLAIEASINGELVTPWTNLPVDVLALLKSAEQAGEYFIWTCTCGVPECGGVYRGVRVTHGPDVVEWHVSGRPFRQAARFAFERAAYRAAVAGVWREFVQTYKAYKAAGIAFETCPTFYDNELLERMERR